MRAGLLSDETRWEIIRDIDVVVAEMPGLHPAFEYVFVAYGVDENSALETMVYLYRAVKRQLSVQPGDRH